VRLADRHRRCGPTLRDGTVTRDAGFDSNMTDGYVGRLQLAANKAAVAIGVSEPLCPKVRNGGMRMKTVMDARCPPAKEAV
jgi:hypothetical protein